MKTMGQIRMTTNRLLLRNIRLEDAPGLLAYRCLPDVYRFQTWKPKTLKDALTFIESTASDPGIPDTWYQLAICLKDSHRLIGDIGIHFLASNGREVELGCTLTPEQQHWGYATEALTAVIDYLSPSWRLNGSLP